MSCLNTLLEQKRKDSQQLYDPALEQPGLVLECTGGSACYLLPSFHR